MAKHRRTRSIKTNNNPFARASNYVVGLMFVTIFFIIFITSQITINIVSGVDIDSITDEVQTQCLTICDASPLSPIDIVLCKKTCTDSVDLARQLTDDVVEGNIGTFGNFFFRPTFAGIGGAIVVFFIMGFLVGMVFNSIMKGRRR